jgi:pimeloyl-ACP methyl ester carboxylesterase|nr:alpha/beta hydrolase family protein [Neorhizobium tomejilense]
MADRKLTFLIVHGAWTGGWSWERVLNRLHAGGHRAYAPTLTGLCERKHLAGPSVNLDTHIDDIVNEAVYKDLTDLVLVGHSYGGIVATGVVERIPERIRSIVYVEAFIPEDGMSFTDYDPEGDYSAPMIPVPEGPGGYLREEDELWAAPKATPQPSGTLRQKLKVTGAYERVPKKTFIVATGWDGPFGQMSEKYRGAPGWTVRELACGHDIPIDLPDELTALLIEAA